MSLLTLLSNSAPNRAYVIATDDISHITLRILFNNHLIRGGYTYWNGKTDLPKEYLWVKDVVSEPVKSMLCVHSVDGIDDITIETRRSEFKEEMEAKVKLEEVERNKKQNENLFDFIS